MEDILQQIDDINTRLDDNDSSLQDFSDNLDSNISDIQSTLDDQSTNLDDLNQTKGQLEFPLTQETIDLIKEQFPIGFATLSSGSVLVKDGRVSANSVILISVASRIGTAGMIAYSASAGQFYISSTSNTDNSIISYLIMN